MSSRFMECQDAQRKIHHGGTKGTKGLCVLCVSRRQLLFFNKVFQKGQKPITSTSTFCDYVNEHVNDHETRLLFVTPCILDQPRGRFAAVFRERGRDRRRFWLTCYRTVKSGFLNRILKRKNRTAIAALPPALAERLRLS